MTMATVRTLLLGCVVVVAAACGSKSAGVVEVRDAWIPAAPPGAPVLALYAQIVPGRDDALIRISTPQAASAEVHESREEDGRMTMRAVPRLELKAGQNVQLAPGGLHGMLMGPTGSVPAGGSVPVTFTFEHSGDITVVATVK